MLILSSTADKLQVVSASAVTCDVHASWVDNASGTITPGRTIATFVTATTNDAVSPPASSTQRNVKLLNVRNRSASSSTVITVQHTDGVAVTAELMKCTLAAGEQLQLTDYGFQVIDQAGGLKNSPATGRFIQTRVLTSGTSFTTSPFTNTLYARLVGGGGGGGGTSTTPNGGAAGGGGGSGGYGEKTFACSPNTLYSYVIGAGGSRGQAAGAGGNGGFTAMTVNGVMVSCNGGAGGLGMAFGTAVTVSLGGAGAATSNTNCDVQGAGTAGDIGFRTSAATCNSGCGGSSIFGGGGFVRIGTVTGDDGKGYGAGGSGGCTVNGGLAVAGGNGRNGVIILDELT